LTRGGRSCSWALDRFLRCVTVRVRTGSCLSVYCSQLQRVVVRAAVHVAVRVAVSARGRAGSCLSVCCSVLYRVLYRVTVRVVVRVALWCSQSAGQSSLSVCCSAYCSVL